MLNLFVLFSVLCVVLNWPEFLSGILWTVLYPFSNISGAYHLSILRKAVPKAIMSKRELNLSDRAHSQLSFAFATFLFVTHVVIISTAWVFLLNGHVDTGRVLERAGLIITSVNGLLLIAALGYRCLSLKNVILSTLKESRQTSQGELDQSLLSQTAAKLQQYFVSTAVIWGQQFLFFLLLALYPAFFTNLSFSKALATIMVAIFQFSGTLSCVFTLIFDIKKWLHEKEVRDRSSKSHDKKEDVSISLRVSISDGDHVQNIIEDLKPKA